MWCFRKNLSYLILPCALVISLIGPYFLIFLGLDPWQAFKSILVGVFPFAIGSFLALEEKKDDNKKLWARALFISIFFTILYLILGNKPSFWILNPWWIVSLLTISYTGFMHHKFSNRKSLTITIYMGTICYGIYLTHMPVITMISNLLEDKYVFIAAVPAVFLISMFTYLCVEQPFSRILKAKR
jgi:peptidoglycan/LPS O-acetylase OafA/YrhL